MCVLHYCRVRVSDMVNRWRALEAQAVSQQRECHKLYALHVDRVPIEHELESPENGVSGDSFDDMGSVESALRTTQA